MLRSQEPLDHSTRLKMAGIAASFYFLHYDEYLRNPCAYRLVGRRMMQVYPALMAEGPHPWTDFVKAMSYKVRRKRFQCRHSQWEVSGRGQGTGYSVLPAGHAPSSQSEDSQFHEEYSESQ